MKKAQGMMIMVLICIATIGLIHSHQKETKEVITEEVQTKIALYYINPNSGKLEKEYRNVSLYEIESDMVGTILKELLKGPQNEELENKIPKGTTVKNVQTLPDKVIVNFSKEFIKDEEKELEQLQKIYEVVNSITEIKEISEVEIDVEGDFYTQKKRI